MKREPSAPESSFRHSSRRLLPFGLMIGVHLLVFALALVLTHRAEAGEPPVRAVVVGGALTEIVYALGAESALVGVDTTSTHPEAATALPQVGYQRNLSTEGVLSLAPDVVFATDAAGPPAVLEQIAEAGVSVEYLASEPTLEAVLTRVRTLAERFGRRSEGEALAREIESDMADARAAAEAFDPAPRVAFLLGTGSGSAMAAGRETGAAAMLAYAGAENVLDAFEGYKPVSAEALIGAAPEAIVVVAHGEGGTDGIVEQVLRVPGVAATPAGEARRVVVADALRTLGFGPRTGEAAYALAEDLAGAMRTLSSDDTGVGASAPRPADDLPR